MLSTASEHKNAARCGAVMRCMLLSWPETYSGAVHLASASLLNSYIRHSWQEHRDVVADALEAVEFREGGIVFRQGEVGDRFYIIAEGAVCVSRGRGSDRTMLAVLAEGAYFGERALIKDETRCVSQSAA